MDWTRFNDLIALNSCEGVPMEQTQVGESIDAQDLLGRSKNSGLFSAEELDQACPGCFRIELQWVLAGGSLMKSKVLTPFQAEHFLAPKSRTADRQL